jgi:hypothetical protein
MKLEQLVLREPKPQPGRTSPVAETPRPTWLGGRGAIESVDPMAVRERWGYVFWGILAAFILTTEAVAAFWNDFWVPTISGTTGRLEQRHDWIKPGSSRTSLTSADEST